MARLGNGMCAGGGRTSIKIPLEDRNYVISAAFTCRWQCVECGFQVEPSAAEPGLGGYREAASGGLVDRRPAQLCQGCGADAWANLREGGVVEALIVQDDERQASRGTRTSGLIRLAALGLFGGLGAAVLIHSGISRPSRDGEIVGLLTFLLAVIGLMAHGAYRQLVRGRRSRFANSWNHALPPRGLGRRKQCGPVRVEGELLRAPLTDRPCLAYELGVRHDSETAAEAWTWTLLEQRCADLSVEGQRPSERPYLRVFRMPYTGGLSASARRALRERGIDPERPGYNLFETIVEPGDEYTLQAKGKGWVLLT